MNPIDISTIPVILKKIFIVMKGFKIQHISTIYIN